MRWATWYLTCSPLLPGRLFERAISPKVKSRSCSQGDRWRPGSPRGNRSSRWKVHGLQMNQMLSLSNLLSRSQRSKAFGRKKTILKREQAAQHLCHLKEEILEQRITFLEN